MRIDYIKMRWGTGDNYCYVLTDDSTKDSWLIDPAEPHEVLPELEKLDINIKAIVNTHHHYDHAGGNKEMLKTFKVPVIGGRDCPSVSVTPANKSTIKLGSNIEVTALYTPCHTQDSICYYALDSTTAEKAVFTGDTLFTSGCGRFFEGVAREMDVALNKVLAGLPDDTKVYPGHEYTMSNVRFSKTVLGENKAIKDLEAFCKANEVTTGKFTIADEKKFNPFMRLSDPNVVKSTGVHSEVEVMDALRTMKNRF